MCFTDGHNGTSVDLFGSGLHPEIERRLLPEGLTGWWNKLYLFSEGLFPPGDRILYFDLDTLITGPLDEIAAYSGPFAILRDVYRPTGLQSSVMAWEAGKFDRIWSEWLEAGKPLAPGGDQEWIERCLDGLPYEIWQHRFPGSFASYKAQCRNGAPKAAKIVFFHGHPRPHEVEDEWVKGIWKVGGGTSMELVLKGNVEAEQIEANIRHALTLGLPEVHWTDPHDGHAVIVGGGPSLVADLDEIKWRQSIGQKIFATNNTWKVLLVHGVQPDIHVLADARTDNAAFIPEEDTDTRCLYASQCHPDVFAAASQYPVTLWHPLHVGMQDLLGNRDYALIGGGSTVGLKAMALAFTLGYREMHLYGFDSCYGESHHAYPQPLNDGERVIDVEVGGQRFRCAPWMVSQANEFQEVAAQLVAAGCTITVHGEGLIPFLARRMERKGDGETVLVDGELWPLRDIECRPAVHRTLGDIDLFVAHTKGRAVCVQAGGNCGIWPQRLAASFDAVYTFEPDALNFRCLAHNVTAPNVVKMQAALGSNSGLVSVERSPTNCGANSIGAQGIIPVLKIDDLGLAACDLIQLDVEGYEYQALLGARDTIARCLPTIVAEEKGLDKKYGGGNIADFLRQFGYRPVARANRDVIYSV